MVQSLHGITINASDREELSVRINNEHLYLKKSNIDMRVFETCHDKPEGISDEEILKDFEKFFKTHNEAVVLVRKKLRLETINSVERYCGKHTENVRREQYKNQIQKDIFDINLGHALIRFMPNNIFLFEGNVNSSVTPIHFELLPEEYENLKKIYTTF